MPILTGQSGPLEDLEGLEQLRFLEAGHKVLCVEVEARGRKFWELNNPEDIPPDRGDDGRDGYGMTDGPPLSVVVASHGRPGALRRCLTALAQSARVGPEAVVVADKEGLEAVAQLPDAGRIRTILQVEPNLAQARK